MSFQDFVNQGFANNAALVNQQNQQFNQNLGYAQANQAYITNPANQFSYSPTPYGYGFVGGYPSFGEPSGPGSVQQYDPASDPNSVWDTGSGRTYSPGPAAPGTTWGSNPTGGYWYPVPILGYDAGGPGPSTAIPPSIFDTGSNQSYFETTSPGSTPLPSGASWGSDPGRGVWYPVYGAQPGTSIIPQQPADATSMSTSNPVTNAGAYFETTTPGSTPLPAGATWGSDPSRGVWFPEWGSSYFPSNSGVSNPAVDAINNAIGPQVQTGEAPSYVGGGGPYFETTTPGSTPLPAGAGWGSDPSRGVWFPVYPGGGGGDAAPAVPAAAPPSVFDIGSNQSYFETTTPGSTPLPAGAGWGSDPARGVWYPVYPNNPQDVSGTSIIPQQPSDATSMSTPNPVTSGSSYQPYFETTTPGSTPLPAGAGWGSDPARGVWFPVYAGGTVPPTSPSEQVSMGYGPAATSGGYDPFFGTTGAGSQYFETTTPAQTPLPSGAYWGSDPSRGVWFPQYPAAPNPMDAMNQMPPPSDQTTGQIGGGGGTPPASLPWWQAAMPASANTPAIVSAIQSVGANYGIDPAATATLISEESNYDPRNNTSGNWGAGQLSSGIFDMGGASGIPGQLNGMTFSQYQDAPLEQQIGAYNDYLSRIMNRNPDLNMGQYSPAVQYGLMQAFNFGPNVTADTPWMQSFLLDGDTSQPVVSSDIAARQANDLKDASGNITMDSLMQAYLRRQSF